MQKYLYKYRSFNQFTDAILLNSELYFSSPLNFNDPFDCQLSFRKFYTEKEMKNVYINLFEKFFIHKDGIRRKLGPNYINFFKLNEFFYKNLLKNMGILSFSKIDSNITMWSHYADNHQGLVFCFEPKKDNAFFGSFIDVDYVKEESYNFLSFLGDYLDSTATLITTKYIDWEYEKEVRILNSLNNGNKRFLASSLSCILFGFRASDINIKKTIQLCQLNGFSHVEFKKAKLVSGKFAIDFNEINKNDYLES